MLALIMRLTGLSKVATIAALVAIGITLLGVAKCTYDRGVTARYEAKVQSQVAKTTERAAEASSKAVTQSQNEMEKSNERARQAAIGSNDRLKSVTDSLRTPAGKAVPPAR